ncbi:MAG TPA: asparagine synthase-related protein [Anaerolineaceae bacterium]|nr:asparagine synthase-related protein [Anaerolineaceae bacterium]
MAKMEFFQAEFNFEKAKIEDCADPECESLALPGAHFCWRNASPLVSIQKQSEWTVFLWGSARYKSEGFASRDVAREMAMSLTESGSLLSCLANLEGGFGVIAWNEKESRLLIATDPIGMTKLYYGESHGKIVISSHAHLAARKLGNRTVSGDGLSLLFSVKGIPAPYTVFEAVSVLRPAELVSITKDGKKSEEYWSILDNVKPFQGSLEDAQGELRTLLEKSLLRMPADGQSPLGIALSSGVDSALLAALMVKLGIPSQALTVGYSPLTRYDESQAAEENARQIGLPIEVLRVSDEEIAGIMDFATQCLPEPLGDATVIPQLLMTLAGKGKVSSIIDGTGADNIFGGMQKFTAERYARQYLKIPKFLRVGVIRPFLNLLPSSRKSAFTDQVRKAQKFIYGVELPEDDQRVYWSRFMSREAVDGMIKPALSPKGYLADQIQLGIRAEVPARFDDFFTSTYASIRGTMPTHATQKLVALQYASGTLYHTPFMTPGLIEFALSLPASFKLAKGETKLVLRRTASKILPGDCATGKKATFSPPIGRWLMGVLKPEFMDLLKGNAFFKTEVIEKMISDQSAGWADSQWELWLVYIFLKWHKDSLR